MENEIDIVTLCKKITELTNMEKCSWKETSENCRYKLKLKSGSIEVWRGSDVFHDSYGVSLYDEYGERYATYEALELVPDIHFETYRALYNSIIDYFDVVKRRKMAKLLDELESV